MSGLLGDDGQLVIKTKFFIGWEMGNITSKKQGKNPLIIKKKAEYIGRPHSKHCLGILKARKIQITLEQSSVKIPWKSKARALPKINVSLATKCKWAQLQKCEGKTLAIRKPDEEWTDRWGFYPAHLIWGNYTPRVDSKISAVLDAVEWTKRKSLGKIGK